MKMSKVFFIAILLLVFSSPLFAQTTIQGGNFIDEGANTRVVIFGTTTTPPVSVTEVHINGPGADSLFLTSMFLDTDPEFPNEFKIEGTIPVNRLNLTNGGSYSVDIDGTVYLPITFIFPLPPTISVSPASLNFGSVEVGTPMTLDFNVMNNGDMELNVSGITLPAGYTIMAGFPPFFVHDHGTYNVQVQFNPTSQGTYDGTITITSDASNSTSFNFPVYGSGTTANSPPVINNPVENELFNAQEGMEFMFTIGATDPDSDPLTFTITAGPGYFTNVNEYRWTPTSTDAGREHTITIQVYDGKDGYDTEYFRIYVNPIVTNNPPSINYPYENEQFNTDEGIDFMIAIAASDPDDDPLVFTVTAGPGYITNVNEYHWTPTSTDAGREHTITIQVYDGKDGYDTEYFRIYVNPTGGEIIVNNMSIMTGATSGTTEFWVYGSGFTQANVEGMDVSTDPTFAAINYTFGTTEITVNPNNVMAVGYFDISTVPAGDYYAKLPTTSGDFITPVFTFTGGAPEPTPPEISVSPVPLYFGSVQVGTPVTMGFEVKNNGDSDLNVSGISLPFAEYTIMGDPSFVVYGHSTYYVQIQFNPTAEQSYNGTITINSNDPVTPRFSLSVEGSGAPAGGEIIVNNMNIITGVTAGTTEFWIYGSGFTQANVEGMDVSTDPAFATINYTFGTTEITVNPNYVMAVGSFDISTVPAGDYYAKLLTTSGDFITPVFTFTGGAPEPMPPEISVSPVPLYFGSVQVGTPVTMGFEVKNNGDSDLNVSSISLPFAEYTIMGDPSFVVYGHSMYYVQIQFNPTAEQSYNGTITINSNDPVTPRFSLSVEGSGAPTGGEVVVNNMSIMTGATSGTTEFWVYGSGFTQANVEGMDVSTDPTFATINYTFGTTEITVNPNNVMAVGYFDISNVPAGDYYAKLLTTSGDFITPVFTFTGGPPEPTPPEISVSPVPLYFGHVQVGTPVTMGFEVKNNGDSDLNVSGITLPFAEYTIMGDPSFVVYGHSTYYVQIQFNPTAEQSYNGTITINSNDPVTPRFSLSVEGSGAPAGGTNSPPVINNPAQNELFYAQEGQEFMFTIGANDPDNDPLTFTITAGPGYFTNVDEYRWTPISTDTGNEHTITIKVEDGQGGYDTRNFRIYVEPYVPPHFPIQDLDGQFFETMVGGEPLELFLGPPDMMDGTLLTYTLVSGPQGSSIETITDMEGHPAKVYRWDPVASEEGIDHQVTITLTGVPGMNTISSTFTVRADVPHFPLEDYAGQTFHATPNHPLDLYLGQISFNETPITFTLNGPGKIVQDIDDYAPEPEQAWFYQWTPTEADFNASFQVNITMNGGPLDGFTATFTVQGFKDFSVSDLVSDFPDTIHILVGETFEFFLGPLEMDQTQITYSLTGPGELINKPDPMDASMFTKVYIWTPTDADIGIPKKVTITIEGGKFGTASGSFYVFAEKPFTVDELISHFPDTLYAPAGEIFEFFLGPLEIDKTQIKYSLTGPGELTTKVDPWPWNPSMIMQVYIWIPTDADIGIPKKVTINIDGGRFGTASGYFYVVAKKPFSIDELLSNFPETEYVRAGEKIEGILGPIEFDKTQIKYSLTGPGELITMPDPMDPNMIMQVYIWTPTEADIGIPIKVTITIDAGKFGSGSRTVNIVVEKAFSVDEMVSYFPDTLYAPVGKESKLFLGPTLISDVPIEYILTSGPGYIVDEYDPKDPEFTSKVFRWTPTDADIGIPKKVTITIEGGKFGTASGSFYVIAEKPFSVDKILSHFPDTLYALVGMESKLFLGPTLVDNMPIEYILTSGLGYIVDEPDPKYPGYIIKVFRWTPTEANIDNPQPVMITVNGGIFGSGSRTFFAMAFIEATLEYFLPKPGELIIEHFDDFLIFLGPVEFKEKILTYTIFEGPSGGEILKMSEPEGTIAVYHWIPTEADINIERTLTLRVTDGERTVESRFRIMTGDTPPVITRFPKDTTIEAGQSYTDYLMATDETPENIRYYIVSPPLGMTIDNINGIISWTPQEWQWGKWTIKVGVTDGDLRTEKMYTIGIISKNTLPVITRFPNDTTIETGQSYTDYVSANDTETPEKISYSLITPTEGMIIDNFMGVISWTPKVLGDYTIYVSVTDGMVTADSSFIIRVVSVDSPPVITIFPKDTLIEVGAVYTDKVSGYDPEGGDIIYSLITYPGNMTIGESDGVIEWIPGTNQIGMHEITVELSDGTQKTGSKYIINIFQSGNLPPIVELPQDGRLNTSVAVGDTFRYQIKASDPEQKDLAYRLGYVFVNPVTINPVSVDMKTGSVSWITHWKDGSPTDIVVEVSDGINTVYVHFRISFTNEPLVIYKPVGGLLETTVMAGKAFNYQVIANDPEGFPLRYSVEDVFPEPKNPISIDPVAGLVSWLSDVSDSSPIRFTVGVSDGKNYTTADFAINLAASIDRVPVIELPAAAELNTTILKGSFFGYRIRAFDPEGMPLYYSLISAVPTPINAVNIDPNTGLVRWQSTHLDKTPVKLEVGITDGVNDSLIVFNINLENMPPEVEFAITGVLDTTITPRSDFYYRIKAIDPEGRKLRYVLKGPEKPTVNPIYVDPSSGIIKWTSTLDDETRVHFIVMVSDGVDFVETEYFINLSNLLPITHLPEAGALDTVIEVGSTFNYQLNAEDPDGQELTYSIKQYLPEPGNNVSISEDGIINWDSEIGDVSPVKFDVIISDGVNIASAVFSVSLTVSGNPLPEITLPVSSKLDTTINSGSQFSYQIVASDPEDQELSYEVVQPAPAPINPVNITDTGLITWESELLDMAPVIFYVVLSDGQNFVILSFTINLLNERPIITRLPEDTVIYARNRYTGKVTGTDPEGVEVVYSLVAPPKGMVIDSVTGEINWYPGLGQVGENTITVRVSDYVNYEEGSFKITVLVPEDLPPVIVLSPVDTTVEVNTEYRGKMSAYDPEGLQVSYILKKYPKGMEVDPTEGEIYWIPGSTQVGTHTTVVGISDNVNVRTRSFEISVFADNPPVIVKMPTDKTIKTGDSYTDQVLGEDPEGKPVTYSLESPPAGMSIDSISGVISWTPASGQEGVHKITVIVTDGRKQTRAHYFLKVEQPNLLPPVITYLPSDTAIEAGTKYKEIVKAEDPEGGKISFSLTKSPSGMSVNRVDGVIKWTPNVDQVGENIVEVEVSDGERTTTGEFTITVTDPVNHPPEFTLVPGDSTIEVKTLYRSKVEGYDPEGLKVIYGLESYPAGMRIKPLKGDITWTPNIRQVGENVIKVGISDGEKVAVTSFTLTVVPPLNQPPYISELPSDENIPAEKEFTAAVEGVDPEGKEVSYYLTSAPTGMSINSSTGEIKWIPSVEQVKTHIITVRVSDGEKFATGSFKLTVYISFNAEPVIVEFPLDGTIGLGQTYTSIVRAYDPEEKPILFSLTNPPSGMTINVSSGVINWRPGGDQIGSHLIKVNISDGVNTVSKSFTLRVTQEENKDPDIIAFPSDAAIKAEVPYRDSVKAVDPEGQPIKYILKKKPGRMTISPEEGYIDWTPSYKQVGTHEIIVIITDGARTVKRSFELTVTEPAPEIKRIYPAAGPTDKDVELTVYGKFFKSGAEVEVGPKTLDDVSLKPDGSITGVLRAPMVAGVYDVKVTNPDGQYDTLPGKYKVLEPIVDKTRPNFLKGSPYSLKPTLTSVTIEWYNDEETIGSLEYGKIISELDVKIDVPLFSSFHSVNITGLDPAAKYYYKVTAIDRSDNIYVSEIDSFTTEAAADETPPVIKLFEPITRINSAVVRFRTNEDADALVLYRVLDSGETFKEKGSSKLEKDHNIMLDGLEASTEYEYRVISTDASGNQAEVSADEFGELLTFKTKAVPDIVPPVIKSVRAVSITDNSAKILWSTNEPATSTVEYGLTTEYGITVKADFPPDPLKKHHVVDLTNLESETEYHFRVMSEDRSGNKSIPSNDFKFRTRKAPDKIPPKFTVKPTVRSKTDNQATIYFETNEFSDTRVSYKESGAEYKEVFDKKMIEPNTPHIITILGLTPDTRYEYIVYTKDESGNEAKMVGPDSPFRTEKAADTTPPKLSPGGIPRVEGITQTSAIIKWITDELSSSRVDYGKDLTYGFKEIGEPGKKHKVAISDLDAGTLYHYRVSSEDGSGNLFVGIDRTFTTPVEEDITKPEITSPPTVKKVTESTATIVWETINEASTSFVEFWLDGTTIVERQGSADFDIKHKVTLTGLLPDTLYYYKVISTDNSPNKNTSEMFGLDSPFRTAAVKDIIPPEFVPGGGPHDKNPNTDFDGLSKSAESSEEQTGVSSITIEWITNEESDSRVDYGLDTNYGEFVYDGTFVTTHSVFIDGLQPGTIYHYFVTSVDPDGNKLTGTDRTFRTPDMPDILPPNVIEYPYVSDKTKNTAVIEWGTDEDSDSFVEYWPVGEPQNIQTVGSVDVTRNHKVTLTNLSAGTYYQYQILSTDVSPNQNTVKMEGSDSPFRTLEEADTNPPNIISGPDASIITTNTAAILWKTDELAISLLKYGKAGSGMTEETRTSIYEFEQKFNLTQLEPNTEYEYTVYSYDKAGNEVKSKLIKSFRTLPAEDETPPVLIEGPVADFKDKSAAFYWMTDEDADSYVFYKTAGSSDPFLKQGSPDMLREHNVIVVDLQPDTDYWFIISSTDFSFNTMAIYPEGFYGDSTLFKRSRTLKVNQPPGGTGSFRTRRSADTQAPVIILGPVVTNVTSSSATVEWVTNENSNSFINYGLTEKYGLAKGTAYNVTEHAVTLTNLDSAVTYNYSVASTDLSNNGPVFSGNAAVTTLAETDIIPPVITAGPGVVSITDEEATVMWITDEPSDSYVEFGFDSTFGEQDTLFGSTISKSLPTDVTEHKITMTNLHKDTLYYIRVASTDISENGPTFSAVDTFRTAKEPDLVPPSLVDSVRIISISDKSVTIKWFTDELSDSFVNYDSTEALEKRLALRKAGYYVEELLENVVGSPRDVTEHTVTVTELEPGMDYTFQAGSIDKSGNEWLFPAFMFFETSALPDLTPPSKPKNLTVIPGNNEVMLTWDSNPESDLAGYNIYRLVDNEFVEIFSQVTDTFYVDKGLKNDSTYYYRITAIDNQSPPNESEFSDEKLALSKVGAVPTAPVIFSPAEGVVVSTSTPVLTIYNAESIREGVTYTFMVSTDSTFTDIVVFETGIEEGAENTSLTLTTALADKTRYYWRSRAFDGYFYGEWMQTAYFDTQLITAVELVSFEAFETDGKVVLKWETASEENNLGFHILKSQRKDGEFIKVNDELIKINDKGMYSFTDKDVETGNTYYYILQSVDINGENRSYQTISITLNVPRQYALYQNYPNPFNPITNVKFDLPKRERVTLKIYNILGQEIKTLMDKDLEPGAHTIQWNGTNNFGIKVASGIYIYQLKAGKFIKAKKMTLIK